MQNDRLTAGAGGSAVGVAVDLRTAEATVSVWIEAPGVPIQGANLSPAAARELAERLTRAAAEAAQT